MKVLRVLIKAAWIIYGLIILGLTIYGGLFFGVFCVLFSIKFLIGLIIATILTKDTNGSTPKQKSTKPAYKRPSYTYEPARSSYTAVTSVYGNTETTPFASSSHAYKAVEIEGTRKKELREMVCPNCGSREFERRDGTYVCAYCKAMFL